MFEIQLHVIALLSSVYTPPPVPALSAIPAYSLTDEELAMPDEQRVAYARGLILQRDYSQLKAAVSDNIETCHQVVQRDYSIASSQCQRRIDAYRIWLWVVIIAIITILIGTFILFYRWMIMPLRRSAKLITSDQYIEQDSGIREMRVLVIAYNALLSRHDKLQSILRSAAETDALTGLPNRYSLEHDVLEAAEDDASLAVLLFDVNYLKRTNDTNGHTAGDKLLRAAGACIRECFETEKNGRCYRIGGDEFAAVLRGCSEEEVQSRIERFSLALERENISVSVGCAYAGEDDENSFEELIKTADMRMYAQKKRIHEQDR